MENQEAERGEQPGRSFTHEEVEQILAQLKAIEINGKHPFYTEDARFFYVGVIYRIELQMNDVSLLVELRKKSVRERIGIDECC